MRVREVKEKGTFNNIWGTFLIGPIRGAIGFHANPMCQLQLEAEGITREKKKCKRDVMYLFWCSFSIGENRDPIKFHAVSIVTHKSLHQ
jgi:hypothetical protein